jgi:hypothetical protein
MDKEIHVWVEETSERKEGDGGAEVRTHRTTHHGVVAGLELERRQDKFFIGPFKFHVCKIYYSLKFFK